MQPACLWRSHRSLPFYFLFLLTSAALFSQAAFAATKTITDANKGGTVHLKAGDTLEVRLNSNPTTGYMWYVEKGSTKLMKLTSQSETKPPEPASGQPIEVGQLIVQVFEFQARQPGEGVLLLHYVRSWEPPAADETRFDLHVVIE